MFKILCILSQKNIDMQRNMWTTRQFSNFYFNLFFLFLLNLAVFFNLIIMNKLEKKVIVLVSWIKDQSGGFG